MFEYRVECEKALEFYRCPKCPVTKDSRLQLYWGNDYDGGPDTLSDGIFCTAHNCAFRVTGKVSNINELHDRLQNIARIAMESPAVAQPTSQEYISVEGLKTWLDNLKPEGLYTRDLSSGKRYIITTIDESIADDKSIDDTNYCGAV